MSFAVGSLVRTRGREWVVLPGTTEDIVHIKPLGGSEIEATAVLPSLEAIEAATFDLPDPSQLGDFRSCRLLRNAVRLSTRSTTGPFRSFGRIAVDPRPYQLVPLMMALKLDPVRLLIADDVGIGKTIEAALIVRELLDRGEIERIAVLCPPPLAEQWQRELADKFHLDAELVLPATASRLERSCRIGQSLFERYPHVVVSLDFIKSERRRDEFVRTCPEFVIVDEAHTCAFGYEGRGGRHQRHQLVQELSNDESRHMLLVTATPHSGNEEAFRSLLGLLNPDYEHLPPDLSGEAHESIRRKVAGYVVQRRRGDIRHYLKTDTPFPEREEREVSYKLSDAYLKLFDRAFRFAKDTVEREDGESHAIRVRWWSALALLRSLGSSPRAAAATLRNRASTADTETTEEADAIGRATVMDLDTTENVESMDLTPGSDFTSVAENSDRRRLLEMAREAERLEGAGDIKLTVAVDHIKKLLDEGFSPIIFCRFIPTAHYVAEELSKRLPGSVEIAAVTGEMAPADRERRVTTLGQASKRVLVCTDCLSEGINLQEHFDAVVHYDLSWNPTRHEQREGRVDRFGQEKPNVRALTLYATNNRIDGIVLDILIKKHKQIRNDLNISIPVPVDTNDVMEAILEGLVLRESWGGTDMQPLLEGLEEVFQPQREDLHGKWESVVEKEKRSRSMFAQHTIRFEEVGHELEQVREAMGSAGDVGEFTVEALEALGAIVSRKNEHVDIDLERMPRNIRDVVSPADKLSARFDPKAIPGTLYLHRTHPVVSGIASHVMESALDPVVESVSHRAGAIRTSSVESRTTVLLIRYRFDLITHQGHKKSTELCEETVVCGFRGAPEKAQWIENQEVEELLFATPEGNIDPELSRDFVSRVIEGFGSLADHLDAEAVTRAQQLEESHRRVRAASKMRGVRYTVDPHLPPDVLGIYVYLPAAKGTL